MRFAFSDEQRAFQRSVRELLGRACPPAYVRAAWSRETRDDALWRALGEVGLLGVAIPEAHGGLGGTPLDWVLAVEEAGRAALPEPLVETLAGSAVLVGAPAAEWLPRIAAGQARLTVEDGPFVAHEAELLILRHQGALHAVARADARLQPQPVVDGARPLFAAEWTPRDATRLGADDGTLARIGALGTAAELCGLALHLIEATVEYVKVRQQFGQAVGAFQAVKHQLANALVKVEFARPLVYRAAYAPTGTHVSMAKAAAGDAAQLAARVALQCHGAIGYSFEHDLHLWMKRAWALGVAFGDAAWHRARVGDDILGGAHG